MPLPLQLEPETLYGAPSRDSSVETYAFARGFIWSTVGVSGSQPVLIHAAESLLPILQADAQRPENPAWQAKAKRLAGELRTAIEHHNHYWTAQLEAAE